MTETKRELFVAVATGQNVANLPPILAFADPERGDEVLWLESEQAKRGRWADGAVEVLQRRGIASERESIQGDVNDPPAVCATLKRYLQAHQADYGRLNIVLNGGQKLTPVGLDCAAEFWRAQHKPVRFLYGEDRPACVAVREERLTAPARHERYPKDKMLTLEEIVIVAVGGTQKAQALSFNPGKVVQRAARPPKYGKEKAFTRLVHETAYHLAKAAAQQAGAHRLSIPPFQQWSPQAQQRVLGNLRHRAQNILGPSAVPRSKEVQFMSTLIRILNGTDPFERAKKHHVAEEVKARLRSEGWWANEGINWRELEEVVAQRVAAFLAQNSSLEQVVREVRLNAQVERDAEWDVVIVLVNGVVIHLECKSWGMQGKDLRARMEVMQRRTSRLARMYVVMPLFPEFAQEPWFAELQQRWDNTRSIPGISLIALTLEGSKAKPGTPYAVHGRRVLSEWPPSFEDSLQEVLAPYVPKM